MLSSVTFVFLFCSKLFCEGLSSIKYKDIPDPEFCTNLLITMNFLFILWVCKLILQCSYWQGTQDLWRGAFHFPTFLSVQLFRWGMPINQLFVILLFLYALTHFMYVHQSKRCCSFIYTPIRGLWMSFLYLVETYSPIAQKPV